MNPRYRLLAMLRSLRSGAGIGPDLRFGLRLLCKHPGFTAITVLTLALGVAGNMVIFSAYNALYLRPLPFAEPDRLVDLDETAPRWNLEYTGLSYPDFDAWRRDNQAFESMAAWNFTERVLAFEGSVDWVRGVRVSRDLFAVLRIQPLLGRGFLPEEDTVGGPKVLLLAHGFWTRHFAGRADILGQTVRLNHEPFTVVGVLPPDEDVFLEGEFWVPLAYDTSTQQGWHLRGIGRLKHGTSLDQARNDLARVHRNLIDANLANANTSPRLTPLPERLFGGTRSVVRALLGAGALVLLIACGNVAALMLARGLARGREFGLRASLGATRARLTRFIGIESLLLAGLGGLAGLWLGSQGLRLLLASLTEPPPRWMSFDIDWRVGLFAGLMIGVAAFLGALPVIRSARRLDLRTLVQSSGAQATAAAGDRRSLHVLVVAEMALTVVVLVQAALLYQTFRRLQTADPGYQPDHLLVCELALPERKYASREARIAFFRDQLERVRGLPGVVSASAVTAPPLGGHWGTFFRVEGAPPLAPNEPDPVVLQRIALPDYFDTMGITLLAGRSFTDQDGVNEGSQAVIVNETFAKRFWPDQNPVGRRISHRNPQAPWMTVVGVARDVKHYGADQPMIPGVYLPFVQDPQLRLALVIRSSVPPASLVSPLRALVREADPDLPLRGVVTMEERLNLSLWGRRLAATLFGVFSVVALLMAAGGVYGVFSYIVNRRTQEIGVRLALGAQRREIHRLVIRQGLQLAGTGIGLGLVGALLVAPVTRSLLFGVSPVEPLTFVAVGLGLVGVAGLACWLPARHAMRVDPIIALRYE